MICIAGKNDIAVNCLEWLLDVQHIKPNTLRVCVNKKGDGFTSKRSLKDYAKTKNITHVELDELYTQNELIFFSLEFDKLINPEKFKTKQLFNIHFSYLPKYRGMYTSAWPILNGESSSGVSLHKIDKGIDTGDIIDRLAFPFEENDTARDLYFKYMHFGEVIFKKNFENILKGNSTATPQEAGGSYYSKSSINYKNLKIDLQKTAVAIKNQIRAFHFKEYQLPEVNGYSINSAEILTTPSKKAAGSILQIKEDFMDIATLDYNVRLYFIK